MGEPMEVYSPTKNMKKLKRPYIYLTVVLVLLTLFSYIHSRSEQKNIETIEVKKGNIVQEVSVTGKTKPVESADLAFEKGGKIREVYVQAGDRVAAGQNLVSLDAGELAAQLKQATADTQANQAKLDELQKGTRPEEITISEAKLTSSKLAMQDAYKNLVDKIQDAYTKSDDAIHNQVDSIFSDSRSPAARLNVSVNDNQLKNDVESGRVQMEFMLIDWQNTLVRGFNQDVIGISADEAKKNLSDINDYLVKVAKVVNMLVAGSSLTQTNIDSYKAGISTARTNINTATSNISAADEKFRTAMSNVLIAQKQLDLDKAGSTPEEIEAQAAQVKQAQASADLIQAQLAKTVLRAPISGTVTRQDAKPGEIATAGTILVSVISQNNLEIEANVPEVDIGKVAAGNAVKITLDAFPGENFTGKVFYIDPAETVVDGVVNFKIKISFDQEDSRLKSGLTSNLYIQTISKSGVLILPQYAIIENNQGKFVRKIENGKTVDIPVTLGIRSQDGMVEVASGVNQGDRVLNIGAKTK